MANNSKTLSFQALVAAIRQVHEHCAAEAGKAVNISLTLRNWAIGLYIREYEQNGSDRAAYGEKLLNRLAEGLEQQGMERVEARELRRYRQFYLTYPQIRESLTPNFAGCLPSALEAQLRKWESPTPELSVDGKTLVTRLSFTHLAELITIDEPLRRVFYEMESIRGNWSVRELKRQIGSLYFERSSLSTDKEKLSEMIRSGAETADPHVNIRDPYVFEFLGIKSREVMAESDVEYALIDRLQDFLLELGHGFCFEARQKRILIGQTYGYVDLVFYHRVLKCHILVELKVSDFNHEHLGQLNTYVSWYKRNMMTPGDNPPIGLLLCTKKDQTLVEYAVADVDNQLFVSKYQLELPTKEDIKRFVEMHLKEALS